MLALVRNVFVVYRSVARLACIGYSGKGVNWCVNSRNQWNRYVGLILALNLMTGAGPRIHVP